MSRIENISGSVGTEVIATSTQISYDPLTGSGHLTFNLSKYLTVDGNLRSNILPSHTGMLSKGIFEIITRRFLDESPIINGVDISVDPVTGADLGDVSVAGVMQIIKAAFDVLYSEHVAQQNPPQTPEPSASPPEATPTPTV